MSEVELQSALADELALADEKAPQDATKSDVPLTVHEPESDNKQTVESRELIEPVRVSFTKIVFILVGKNFTNYMVCTLTNVFISLLDSPF